MHPYHAAEKIGIKDAYQPVIMTNGTIVVKISPSLNVWVISRNNSVPYLKNTLKYFVYTHSASFEIQNGGCMIRV